MKQTIRREIIAWFWVGLVFLLINGAIGQARVIPSGSMENTLLIGDHLIMSRIGYDAGIPFTNLHVPLWRNPKRQRSEERRVGKECRSRGSLYREIGNPDEIVDNRDGSIWLNGHSVMEQYITAPAEHANTYQF